MRAERLFRALGLVDPALVEEALTVRRRVWRRWAAMAACLALVVGLGWLVTGGFGGYGSGMGGSSGGAGSSAGSGAGGPSASPGEGIAFMSYAGPVLPLTTLEDPAALTAERTVTWDLAPGAYPDGAPRQWGAAVTDAYVLRNDTEEDITVTALYPFTGSFDDLPEIDPQAAVDGEAVDPALYAGLYSGGFQSTVGADTPDTMNLLDLGDWKGYKALLESGEYQAQALEADPALDIPVTVYEFSDFAAPLEEYPAATQAISFCADPEKTTVLTYGFNGMDWDGASRRYSYFVPDGKRREPEVKLLVVLGEDVGDYALQGYQDGGCDPGEELDGVSCSVTRRESTLDAVLDLACRDFVELYGEERVSEDGPVTFAMVQRAAAELLRQYGPLSGASMDRYADGRLDDILSEALCQERVLYLSFPVTVPAGGSVDVACALWKRPSFDFAGSGSQNAGLQGYDLMTRLGSTLTFARQRAALANPESVEITGQNFGFDVESGVIDVELDLEREHYYLEIRPKEG